MQTVTQHEIGLLKALLTSRISSFSPSLQPNFEPTLHYDARILKHNKERLAHILNKLRSSNSNDALVALEELSAWCDDPRAYHPDLRPLLVLCVKVNNINNTFVLLLKIVPKLVSNADIDVKAINKFLATIQRFLALFTQNEQRKPYHEHSDLIPNNIGQLMEAYNDAKKCWMKRKNNAKENEKESAEARSEVETLEADHLVHDKSNSALLENAETSDMDLDSEDDDDLLIARRNAKHARKVGRFVQDEDIETESRPPSSTNELEKRRAASSSHIPRLNREKDKQTLEKQSKISRPSSSRSVYEPVPLVRNEVLSGAELAAIAKAKRLAEIRNQTGAVISTTEKKNSSSQNATQSSQSQSKGSSAATTNLEETLTSQDATQKSQSQSKEPAVSAAVDVASQQATRNPPNHSKEPVATNITAPQNAKQNSQNHAKEPSATTTSTSIATPPTEKQSSQNHAKEPIVSAAIAVVSNANAAPSQMHSKDLTVTESQNITQSSQPRSKEPIVSAAVVSNATPQNTTQSFQNLSKDAVATAAVVSTATPQHTTPAHTSLNVQQTPEQQSSSQVTDQIQFQQSAQNPKSASGMLFSSAWQSTSQQAPIPHSFQATSPVLTSPQVPVSVYPATQDTQYMRYYQSPQFTNSHSEHYRSGQQVNALNYRSQHIVPHANPQLNQSLEPTFRYNLTAQSVPYSQPTLAQGNLPQAISTPYLNSLPQRANVQMAPTVSSAAVSSVASMQQYSRISQSSANLIPYPTGQTTIRPTLTQSSSSTSLGHQQQRPPTNVPQTSHAIPSPQYSSQPGHANVSPPATPQQPITQPIPTSKTPERPIRTNQETLETALTRTQRASLANIESHRVHMAESSQRPSDPRVSIAVSNDRSPPVDPRPRPSSSVASSNPSTPPSKGSTPSNTVQSEQNVPNEAVVTRSPWHSLEYQQRVSFCNKHPFAPLPFKSDKHDHVETANGDKFLLMHKMDLAPSFTFSHKQFEKTVRFEVDVNLMNRFAGDVVSTRHNLIVRLVGWSNADKNEPTKFSSIVRRSLWPPDSTVVLDGKVVPVHQLIEKRTPDPVHAGLMQVSQEGRNVPACLSYFLQPTREHTLTIRFRPNEERFQCACMRCKKFEFAIHLLEAQTHDKMRRRIMTNTIPFMHTIQMIKALARNEPVPELTPLPTTTRQTDPISRASSASSIASTSSSTPNHSSHSDDDLIVSSAIPVPSTCPVTLQPIKTPARGPYCNHVSCFDLDSYLMMFLNNAETWKQKCPICKAPAPIQDVRVCEWFRDVLVPFVERNEHCESVTVTVGDEFHDLEKWREGIKMEVTEMRRKRAFFAVDEHHTDDSTRHDVHKQTAGQQERKKSQDKGERKRRKSDKPPKEKNNAGDKTLEQGPMPTSNHPPTTSTATVPLSTAKQVPPSRSVEREGTVPISTAKEGPVPILKEKEKENANTSTIANATTISESTRTSNSPDARLVNHRSSSSSSAISGSNSEEALELARKKAEEIAQRSKKTLEQVALDALLQSDSDDEDEDGGGGPSMFDKMGNQSSLTLDEVRLLLMGLKK